MNRYFHFTDDPPDDKRVIVFEGGVNPGYSWWNECGKNTVEWYLHEMILMPSAKPINRSKALRIVKNLP